MKTFILTIVLILSSSILMTSDIYSNNSVLKELSLGMTSDQVLLKMKKYNPQISKIEHKYTKNHISEGYENNPNLNNFSYDDENIRIINSDITLKNIFSLKFGDVKILHNEKTNELMQQTDNYPPYQAFNYIYLPIYKINPYLVSIELTFFKDKLFNITYYVDLNNKYVDSKYQQATTYSQQDICESFIKNIAESIEKDFTRISSNIDGSQWNSKDGKIKIILTPLNNRYQFKIQYIDQKIEHTYNNSVESINQLIKELLKENDNKLFSDFSFSNKKH